MKLVPGRLGRDPDRDRAGDSGRLRGPDPAALGARARQRVTVLNAPGTIDSDYRGEVRVLLDQSRSKEPFIVTRGMRIAQIVFAPVIRATLASAPSCSMRPRAARAASARPASARREPAEHGAAVGKESACGRRRHRRRDPRARPAGGGQGARRAAQLPPRHLEPVLQALVHAGILKGVRGPRGGYRAGARAAPHFRGRDRARRRSDRRRRSEPGAGAGRPGRGPGHRRMRRKRSRTRLPASASKAFARRPRSSGLPMRRPPPISTSRIGCFLQSRHLARGYARASP